MLTFVRESFTLRFFLFCVGALLVFSLPATAVVPWSAVLIFVLLVLAWLVLIWAPLWGLYAMAATLPFQGLMVYYGSFDAPYVDVIGVLTLAALATRHLLNYLDGRLFAGEAFLLNKRAGMWPAIFFALATALSFINAPEPLAALKYWLRPICFFYLVYVLLPQNLLPRKSLLRRVVFIFFVAAVVAALNAFLSVILASGPWYAHRAQPYIIFGKNLFGGNHNAVAEVLTAAVPFGWYLFFTAAKIKTKGWYLLAIGFCLFVLLMTFSRSGWLALGVQGLLFAAYHLIGRVSWRRFWLGVVTVSLALTVFYVAVWSQAEWIRSSDSSRLLMAQIAYDSFANHPVVGAGLNSFENILLGTFLYSVEFADPLDAHGFLQKLITETGAVGLLAYLGLLIWVGGRLYRAWKILPSREKPEALSLVAVFAGLVVFELFSTSYFQAKMWLLLGLAMAWTEQIFAAREKTWDWLNPEEKI